MEILLSHSFDYLSSSSPQKIRKGLRHVEGLLAQICLSRSPPANKRHSMIPLGQQSTTPPPKKMGDLKDDPAFREFVKLQQGFQWNVAMRLISCLERLLGKGSNGQNDLLIISALDLLQGVLLLHPASRELFAREIHMNVRPAPSCAPGPVNADAIIDPAGPPRPVELSCHTIIYSPDPRFHSSGPPR
jgi:Cell division control protein 14, SIN component